MTWIDVAEAGTALAFDQRVGVPSRRGFPLSAAVSLPPPSLAIDGETRHFTAASAADLAQAAHAGVAATAGVEARIAPDRMANAIRAPAMDAVERAVPPDFVGMRTFGDRALTTFIGIFTSRAKRRRRPR